MVSCCRQHIKGTFREDLRKVREPLREARNAVMHVSDDAYLDDRLFLIVAEPDSAAAIRRVHMGYARLFFEELQARRQTQLPEPTESPGLDARQSAAFA